jgi:hypothetical protein
MTNEAYSEKQYEELLTQTGFGEIQFFPSLVGVEVKEESQAANLVILGRRKVGKNENGNKCIFRCVHRQNIKRKLR